VPSGPEKRPVGPFSGLAGPLAGLALAGCWAFGSGLAGSVWAVGLLAVVVAVLLTVGHEGPLMIRAGMPGGCWPSLSGMCR
jgi:hypothetical protein